MRVAVFGGSAPQPGQPAYLEAQHLGEMLAKAGHEVVTGGYMGVMEAVSRGAAEAGGHVIGVTCKEIERLAPDRSEPMGHRVGRGKNPLRPPGCTHPGE